MSPDQAQSAKQLRQAKQEPRSLALSVRNWHPINIPIKGTESEVAGMISATSSMKTVRDRRTVMPAGEMQRRKRVRQELSSGVLSIFKMGNHPSNSECN